MNKHANSRSQHGITLIELMVVVAVVGILAMIAVPSYRQYVVKSNRAAAEAFIMSVANKQEQYMLDARTYAGVAADPGDSSGLTTLGLSAPNDVSKNYNIKIGAVSNAPPTYKITAEPTGSQATNDTQCGSVSINQAGTKAISGTGSVAACW